MKPVILLAVASVACTALLDLDPNAGQVTRLPDGVVDADAGGAPDVAPRDAAVDRDAGVDRDAAPADGAADGPPGPTPDAYLIPDVPLPDLGVDAASAVPTRWRIAPLAESSETALLGGELADLTPRPCPAGAFAVGIEALLNGSGVIIGLRAACAELRLELDDDAARFVRVDAGFGEWGGVNEGRNLARLGCGADEVAVGLAAVSVFAVQSFALRCGTLEASPVFEGAWLVRIGARSTSPAVGSDNAERALDEVDCAGRAVLDGLAVGSVFEPITMGMVITGVKGRCRGFELQAFED